MTSPLSTYVDGFIVSRSYSPNSARQRRVLIGRFIDQTADPHPSAVDFNDVLAWWDGTSHLAVASRRAHLAAIRGFFDHLVAVGRMAQNPVRAITAPTVRKAPPVVLSDVEVAEVVASARTVLDRAIILLMLGSGLRSSDVAALRIEDIDHQRHVLSVEGKGGKTRLVPVPGMTLAAVQMLAGPRTHGPLVECGSVAMVHRSGFVRAHALAVLQVAGVKQYALDGRSPHVLRRTCATRLVEAGVALTDVQEILGHESVATTMHYVARANVRRLSDAIELGPLFDMELPRAA